jgi:predicted double-glycine peptidase
LSVDCVVDDGVYEKGVEVTDEEFKAIKIKLHKFHGEWNYAILPQKKSEQYKSEM